MENLAKTEEEYEYLNRTVQFISAILLNNSRNVNGEQVVSLQDIMLELEKALEKAEKEVKAGEAYNMLSSSNIVKLFNK